MSAETKFSQLITETCSVCWSWTQCKIRHYWLCVCVHILVKEPYMQFRQHRFPMITRDKSIHNFFSRKHCYLVVKNSVPIMHAMHANNVSRRQMRGVSPCSEWPSPGQTLITGLRSKVCSQFRNGWEWDERPVAVRWATPHRGVAPSFISSACRGQKARQQDGRRRGCHSSCLRSFHCLAHLFSVTLYATKTMPPQVQTEFSSMFKAVVDKFSVTVWTVVQETILCVQEMLLVMRIACHYFSRPFLHAYVPSP
jgi:hypothetical protein